MCRTQAQLRLSLRTPGSGCCLGGRTQEQRGKECLTGPARVFQVVVWTCWDLCQLSWLVLTPSADVAGKRELSPFTSTQHPTVGLLPWTPPYRTPCTSQLLLSLAVGTGSLRWLPQAVRSCGATRGLSLPVGLGGPGAAVAQ